MLIKSPAQKQLTAAFKKDGTVIWKNSNEPISTINLGEASGVQNSNNIHHSTHAATSSSYKKYNNLDSNNLTFNYLNNFKQGSIDKKSTKYDHASLLGLSAPEIKQQPFSIDVVATGPYRAPANVLLVANVHLSDNRSLERIDFYVNGSNLLGSISEPPYELPLGSGEIYFGSPGYDNSYSGLSAGTYPIDVYAFDSEGEIAKTSITISISPSNRYDRGVGFTPHFYGSSLTAIDAEEGVLLDHIKDFTTIYGTNIDQFPWFLRADSALKDPCYHLSENPTGKTPETYEPVNSLPQIGTHVIGGQPPLVAFGSQAGKTPLYVNQYYRFGLDVGTQNSLLTNNDLKIEVYEKKSFVNGASKVLPIITQNYTLPRPENKDVWSQFNAQGCVQDYHLLQTNNGQVIDFETQVQYPIGIRTSVGESNLMITHKAANPNYCYRVSVMGAKPSSANPSQLLDLAKNASTDPKGVTLASPASYNMSYTLDFDATPSWGITFINLPHFQGVPLPSSYQGKSVDELIHQAPMVQDQGMPTTNKDLIPYTCLDNSPEIKKHPVLDKLVSELGSDPMALAKYVLNEIELTDPIGFNVNGSMGDVSINPPGVSRYALATYLERQGSPTEQCALLVYLLRQAGVPAAYVFPDHNEMLMFDSQLSKLLQMQIRGTLAFYGEANLPELIPVNYPWVAAYIDGKWIHLFPWLKETEITEGKNLWDYFPVGYQTGGKWLMKYLLNDPNIRSLSKEDHLAPLFEAYANQKLSAAGLTLDDVGMKIVDREQNCSTWDDFPRPWKTPTITKENLVANLDATSPGQNPKMLPFLKDIFDTIDLTIFSDRKGSKLLPGSSVIRVPDPGDPVLKTGVLRMVDLHDRRLLLYHQLIEGSNPIKYNLILSLEPYDSADITGSTYTFNTGSHPDPGNLRAAQKISVPLQTTNDTNNDDLLWYNISYARHRQAKQIDFSDELEYYKQFPELTEGITVEDSRPLHKGDMALLSLNYGRVSQEMEDFQVRKYEKYQNHVKNHPNDSVDPEQAIGQLLQVMGTSYYHKVTKFHHTIEKLTKTHCFSTVAHGLVKLSPQRNPDGTPTIIKVNGHQDLNLSYPNVDMSFQRIASIGHDNTHLDSGESVLNSLGAMQLIIGEGSADEHCVINQFFGQKAAISTVKLLDLAQGWTPETGTAAHPGTGVVILTADNYQKQGDIPYDGTISSTKKNQKLSDWAKYAGLWNSILNTLNNASNGKQGLLSTAIMTPAPITAPVKQGVPFTGMGAMILGIGEYTAAISENMIVTHGGSGEPLTYTVPSSNPSTTFVNQGNLSQNNDGDYSYSNIPTYSQG